MLDLDPRRSGALPRDAATLILVRDAAAALEVFCVERHKKSGFLGGAVVFPGGKVDPSDSDPAWAPLVTAPHPRARAMAPDAELAALQALVIAACRESLEEAAILPIIGGAVTHDELLALRAECSGDALRAFLAARGLRLDLGRLHPLARWITPAAESRRFDTRFFLAVAPEGQPGAHDEHETTRSFWAQPADVLLRWERGEVMLLPPTHRTLEQLALAKGTDDALARSNSACLEPICPLLVQEEGTLALALPGDPAHEIDEVRVPGRSRYVLRGERWLPEDAPTPSST